MSVTVSLPAVLAKLAEGRRDVESSGATLGEVVADLSRRYPELGPRLRDRFEAEAAQSVEIRLEDWKKRSLAARLWERFAYLFRWWL